MLNRKRVFKVDIFQKNNWKAARFVCRAPWSKNNIQLRRKQEKKEKMTFTDLWMHFRVKSTSTVKSTFSAPSQLKPPSSSPPLSVGFSFTADELNKRGEREKIKSETLLLNHASYHSAANRWREYCRCHSTMTPIFRYRAIGNFFILISFTAIQIWKKKRKKKKRGIKSSIKSNGGNRRHGESPLPLASTKMDRDYLFIFFYRKFVQNSRSSFSFLFYPHTQKKWRPLN